MLEYDLKVFPKCEYCGNDCSISSHYHISNTCGSSNCSHKKAESTKMKYGNHNFGYNGDPDHDSKLWYWHSQREYSKINDGIHPLVYSSNTDHNMFVYDNHIKSCVRGDSGSFGYKTIVFHNNKLYRLRSKLEFIFASYLTIKKYNWRYEEDHTSFGLNDFCVNNHMFEVKQYSDEVPEEQIIQAKLAKYKFHIITSDLLYHKCCKYLVSKDFPIWNLLRKITEDTTIHFNFDDYVN